jgi:HEAT repeat protein
LKAVDAVLPLIQSLNDVSQIVRKSAIRSLGQIGDPRALEIIEHAVSDSNQVVANMAKTVMEQLKTSE